MIDIVLEVRKFFLRLLLLKLLDMMQRGFSSYSCTIRENCLRNDFW